MRNKRRNERTVSIQRARQLCAAAQYCPAAPSCTVQCVVGHVHVWRSPRTASSRLPARAHSHSTTEHRIPQRICQDYQRHPALYNCGTRRALGAVRGTGGESYAKPQPSGDSERHRKRGLIMDSITASPTACEEYPARRCSVFYSPCCKSEVVVAGDGQTHWHSCARCGRPCDPLTASVSGILAHLSNPIFRLEAPCDS